MIRRRFFKINASFGGGRGVLACGAVALVLCDPFLTQNHLWLHIIHLYASQYGSFPDVGIKIFKRSLYGRNQVFERSHKPQRAEVPERKASNFGILMFAVLEKGVNGHDGRIRVLFRVRGNVEVDHLLGYDIICVGYQAHFIEQSADIDTCSG